MPTLTSANSIIILAVPNLLPVPTQLQGYAADEIFTSSAMDNKEISMGLDSIMSVGWVPVPFDQTYTLQANSASVVFFDALWASEQQLRDAYPIQGNITLPGLGRTYQLVSGTLRNYQPMANAGKILAPRPFMISWERVQQLAF